MSKDFITIQEAAELLDKSTQTIRRMIKRGELMAKKIRTPQGFHYVIARDSIDTLPWENPMPPAEVPQEPPMPSPTIIAPTPTLPTPPDETPETNSSELIDRKELTHVLERHHHETILMIEIIQKLQAELDKERRRPRSFWGHFFDWWSQ